MVIFNSYVWHNQRVNHLVKSFAMIFPEPFKVQFRRTSPSHIGNGQLVGGFIPNISGWMTSPNCDVTGMIRKGFIGNFWFVRVLFIPHRRPNNWGTFTQKLGTHQPWKHVKNLGHHRIHELRHASAARMTDLCPWYHVGLWAIAGGGAGWFFPEMTWMEQRPHGFHRFTSHDFLEV